MTRTCAFTRQAQQRPCWVVEACRLSRVAGTTCSARYAVGRRIGELVRLNAAFPHDKQFTHLAEFVTPKHPDL